MADLDEILEKNLDAIVQGASLEEILAELPPEAQELAPLIRLAVQTGKSGDNLQPMPEHAVQAQRARVMAAVRATRAPHAPDTLPVANKLTGRTWLSRASAWLLHPNQNLARRWAAAAAMGVVVVLGVSIYLAGPAAAHSAQLTQVTGLVEVAPTGGSSDWQFAANGAGTQVSAGAHIRTYAQSGGTLVFFDGSRTDIGPDTDVVLTHLDGQWGNHLQVELSQKSGATTNNVIPLKSSTSFFRIDTPSGQASVHGTSFDVQVDNSGGTVFAVTHGKVQVTNPQAQVLLASGQATNVLPDQKPEQPAYQFKLTGKITNQQPNQWIVAGVAVAVNSRTKLLGTPNLGDAVFVQGRISGPDVWTADRIEPYGGGSDPASRFTGTIDLKTDGAGTWQIGGQSVQVDAQTQLSQNLKVGSAVEVRFSVSPDSGIWLAQSITNLEEEGSRPTPIPSITPTTARTATQTPESSTATPLPLNAATLTPPPDTATPPATATVIPKNDTQRCDNRSEQQPEALRLAQRYGVSYDEIMGWFCKGFGFGEIDLAYSLSQSSGTPVSEIFAQRSAGSGWGQIKKQLNAQSTPSAAATAAHGKGSQPTNDGRNNGSSNGNNGNGPSNGNNGNKSPPGKGPKK